MKKLTLLAAAFLFAVFSFSQKQITLEDCFETFTFYPEGNPGFQFLNDGKSYLTRQGMTLTRHDLTTGDSIGTILDGAKMASQKIAFRDFLFSDDESKMLLATKVKPIYRHSFSAEFFVHDLKTGATEPLFTDARQQEPTFSPDASRVAWMSDNNLFIKELASGKVSRVTSDGKKNEVINGVPDWVYEEEFSPVAGDGMKALAWSADSRRLAFIRFDERLVPEFSMPFFEGGMYPRIDSFKYPKVGEANSFVTIKIYDTTTGQTIVASTGAADADHYLPRINWSRDPQKLTVERLNRHQNRLELLAVDAATGQATTLLEEVEKTWVDVHDNLVFLPDGQSFLWTSEADGFNHFYRHDISGKRLRQLTKGDFEVTAFYGFDEKTNTIFYQTAQPTPLDRQIWSLNIAEEAAQPVCLTPEKGTSEADFSPTFDFFVLNWSDANTPPQVSVRNRAGQISRQLVDNEPLVLARNEYGFSKKEFFNFKTADGIDLNGWLMKPANFDARRKYPVLMSVYGGPGSQEVLNNYDGFYGTWYQMLNQNGVVVACIDNRGTGGRGKAFESCTHLDLGHLEVIDQTEAARFLARQPWADASRIGIWGWSYGGYMSSNCLFKSADVFKSAMAVAPVTNWKWYDSAYTERYLHTEKENPKGYADNSPIHFADKMRGNFFLAHGLGDDNVHWQNSAELSNSLIKNNKQFEEHYYPNRNHGIYGDGATMHLFWELTEFVLTKL